VLGLLPSAWTQDCRVPTGVGCGQCAPICVPPRYDTMGNGRNHRRCQPCCFRRKPHSVAISESPCVWLRRNYEPGGRTFESCRAHHSFLAIRVVGVVVPAAFPAFRSIDFRRARRRPEPSRRAPACTPPEPPQVSTTPDRRVRIGGPMRHRALEQILGRTCCVLNRRRRTSNVDNPRDQGRDPARKRHPRHGTRCYSKGEAPPGGEAARATR